MRTFKQKWKESLKERSFMPSVLLGVLFLVIAIAINFIAGSYATESATGFVGDIILSNIPVVDVDAFFVFGPIAFWVIIALFTVDKPARIPFILKSIALFVIIRSIFITLTHIGPFPDRVAIDSFAFSSKINLYIFNSGADLFFSGHTGLPLLMALIYWDDRNMRFFCILASIFFAAIVLLGHLHYSIDVLSAFFITYAIYNIAFKFFKKDRLRYATNVEVPR